MQIGHTICYKFFAYSVQMFYSFFIMNRISAKASFALVSSKPSSSRFSHKRTFLREKVAIISVTFPPSQWGNDKNKWFFLSSQPWRSGTVLRPTLAALSAWRCFIWCLYDVTSNVCTVTCKEKCVSMLKHDKMARECTHYRDTGWGTMVVFHMRRLNLDSYGTAVDVH